MKFVTYLLLINIPLVPREDVSQIRIGLVGVRVQGALDLHPDVHAPQRGRHDAPRQLHVHAGQVAR